MPTSLKPSAQERPVIVWFREDLRLADNPALHAAVATKRPILAIFVFDESARAPRALGGARRWWLHHALEALARDITAKGGALHLFDGDAAQVVPALAKSCDASGAFWNHRYDKNGRAQDVVIERSLSEHGCGVETFNGKLLIDPTSIHTKSGTPFRIYSQFARTLEARGDPAAPLPAPRRIQAATLPDDAPASVSLASLNLLPRKPDWAGGLRATWTVGEQAAAERLRHFIDALIDTYAEGRDIPAIDATTRLSPHLCAGALSSRQVWHAAHHAREAGHVTHANFEKLSRELIWRDYAYHLLLNNPDIANANLNTKFDRFVWATKSDERLHAWQTGMTGYPIVDAGMRQLWQTGWMHNRVRLIVGSFLAKHLLIDWRAGETWFWDTLCDGDPANNAMNWQWIAGSGADAAPYFRIFNPTLQGERFDPNGDYVRAFVPELGQMPARFIHKPSEAPPDILAKAGVALGRDYPPPIVDHGRARETALAAFQAMRA